MPIAPPIRRFARRCLALSAALLLWGPAVVAGAAGGSSSMPDAGGGGGSSRSARTPEELAESKYRSGLKRRDKAWKYEARADETSNPKKRAKLLGKAQKQYAKAIDAFLAATERDPQHYRAFSSLGYAYRRSGEYELAIEAYDTALRISPGYPEALEYRGEAYLELNQLDEAQQTYMRLFVLDRERADELMTAMERWLERRRADPQQLSSRQIEAFSEWLSERKQLAGQTAELSGSPPARW